MDTGLTGSQTSSVMLGKVSRCLTVTLILATNEEIFSAWVQLFGLVAISQAVPSAAPAELKIYADIAEQDE